ncbi:MAG: Spy/CpxP family protein refolding chaperone [Ignavibacteria bacterium]|nr:Spy/CpxP family protein refolding chaperone [Ignavibacteria bacterium]
MKTTGFVLALAILTIGAVVFFTGCSDKGSVNSPWQQNFEIAQFAIIDYGDLQNAIEDGTTETDMTFNSTMLNYSFASDDRPFGPGQPMMRGIQWFDRFDFTKHLGFFFRQLNLTDDQKAKIRDLAKTFHADMKPLVQQFHDANKDIISAANAKRRLIAESLKTGKITREVAAAELKTLNQGTRDLIDANPASLRIKTAMCAERDKLFAGIRAVLQGDQVTKWNDWISKIRNQCAP